VEVHREQAQYESGDGRERRSERGQRVVADAECDHRGADDRWDRVQVAVPAQQRGHLVGEDVAQHTAAHCRGHAEDGGRREAESVVVRLRRPGDAEQAETGRVEDVDGHLGALHLRVEEEDQEGGEQRGQEVAQVREGSRRGADDQVPEQPSAERGDLGEHGYAEDVEVLADGQQRAGDREDENTDGIERVLDGGGEQLLEHPYILTYRTACTLQSKARGRRGRDGPCIPKGRAPIPRSPLRSSA